MKKYLILATIILQTTFLFGQSSDWSSWASIDCYRGFQLSSRNNGIVNSVNKYSWNVRVKNNYNKKVHFSLYGTVGGEKTTIGRFSLNPGESTVTPAYYYNSNSSTIYAEIDHVCFGENWGSCSNNCYAQCDNGTPNQPDCNGNNGNQSGNSNSQNDPNSTTTQPQNDLNFDKNNASFQDYYKQAMAAKDAGNYAQSESYLNSAISVAVNDAQRNNAKAWLTEVQKAKANSSYSNNNSSRQTTTYSQPQPTKSQRQIEGLNQLSGLLTDFSNSIAKQKQEQREREQREKQEQLAKQQEEQNKIENEKRTAALQQESYLQAHLGHTTINTDYKNRFNLINSVVKKNDVNMILVNYSTKWCMPCREQIEELMKLPDHYQYEVIQVVGNYEEMEADATFFKERNFKKPVYYVSGKDFDANILNKDGVLPSLYAYWENEPKGNVIGLLNATEIKTALQKTKDFYFTDKTGKDVNNTLDLGQLTFNETLTFRIITSTDIKSATSSCGCIQLNLDDFVLYVTFIPNFEGAFLKRIQLTSNDEKVNELIIKGTVKK